ncbi:hypothetical protein [Methyloceanibacter sp. wino2]|uniref:hypothetical protein n=1 Tax=Methyloceanibacter sp. wino2 TaxID=2170729 RepID=UPI000D3E5BBD|nr:hypothetical protein [Methyloceanibacter sp. wino2]
MILTLISQVKQRIDNSISAVVHKVIVIAVAIVCLLFAAAFGLVAAYYALVDSIGLRPIEAAGIVAGCLLGLALVVLAILPLAARTKSREAAAIAAPGEALALVDKGLSRATQRVGALPLVAIAFVSGFLATRR